MGLMLGVMLGLLALLGWPALLVAQPGLNVNDFNCFTNSYASGLPYANCDGSLAVPQLTVNDFVCFQNRFAMRDPWADCDAQGWTDLTPPPGALVFFVSSSMGSDANAGTQAAPFASIGRGLAALRNGQPDQVLLKCGDAWTLSDQITLTKSASWDGQGSPRYMVLGSYGAGPRPRIRTPSHGIFGGNVAARSGFAIVGVDLAPIGITAGSDGIILLSTTGAAWENVLIEDCYISGYSAAIVAQSLVDGQVFSGLKIRRCVIVDNDNNGGGHAQGIFLGGAVSWLVEECVLDNNARSKADMFCHNLYVHELSGAGIFRGNISSRACSHGGQQRPGGTAEQNLFLQNPINFYIASSVLPAPYRVGVNYFRNNVALDSRDINSIDRRGFGFVLGDCDELICEDNIAAHQRSGTAAVTAFDFAGPKRATVRRNLVFDWTWNQMGWGTAFDWDDAVSSPGPVLFEFNRAYQPNHGMLVRHENRCLDGLFTYRMNRYFSTNPATGYDQFTTCGGVTGGGFAWWVARAGEKGSVFGNLPTAPDGTIAGYMSSINRTGDLVEFVTEARKQSRQNWREEFTAGAVVAWEWSVWK